MMSEIDLEGPLTGPSIDSYFHTVDRPRAASRARAYGNRISCRAALPAEHASDVTADLMQLDSHGRSLGRG